MELRLDWNYIFYLESDEDDEIVEYGGKNERLDGLTFSVRLSMEREERLQGWQS